MPGKTHLITHAPSRAPVFELEEFQDLTIDTAVICLKYEADPAVAEIVTGIDCNYRLITYALKDGLEANEPKAKHPAAKHDKIWSRLLLHEEAGKQLSLLDSAKILIPTRARRKLLELVHRAHSGYRKSYKKATQLYY